MGENVVGRYYYPAAAMEVSAAELGQTAGSKCYDDDGRPKRTGKFQSRIKRLVKDVRNVQA